MDQQSNHHTRPIFSDTGHKTRLQFGNVGQYCVMIDSREHSWSGAKNIFSVANAIAIITHYSEWIWAFRNIASHCQWLLLIKIMYGRPNLFQRTAFRSVPTMVVWHPHARCYICKLAFAKCGRYCDILAPSPPDIRRQESIENRSEIMLDVWTNNSFRGSHCQSFLFTWYMIMKKKKEIHLRNYP